jgi:TRAP-type C4-dicarboxylate transport system permease large subunit
MAVLMMLVVHIIATKRNMPREEAIPSSQWKGILFRGALPLSMPIVLLGGIYSGAFTPTEAAAVSCIYALVIGLFVERQMKLADLPGLFASAMRTSGVVCAIIAVSTGFGILVAQEQIAVRFATWMAGRISPVTPIRIARALVRASAFFRVNFPSYALSAQA